MYVCIGGSIECISLQVHFEKLQCRSRFCNSIWVFEFHAERVAGAVPVRCAVGNLDEYSLCEGTVWAGKRSVRRILSSRLRSNVHRLSAMKDKLSLVCMYVCMYVYVFDHCGNKF